MYAQLGTIQFSALKGFAGLTSTRETNLAEHALIEGKPKLQRIGTNLATMELSMMFDASFCNPQAEVDALNSSRELAEVMPLIMGSGRFVGNFVIRAVTETALNHADDGTLLQAEVSASLVEYVNADQAATDSANAISQAFANVNNSPAAYVPQLTAITAEMQATSGLVDASAGINTTVDTLSGMAGFVELYRPKAQAVVQDMLKSGDLLNDVLQTINADPLSEMWDRTRDLALAIEQTLLVTADITIEAEALIQDIDAGNTANVPGHIVELTNKAAELDNKSKQISQTSASLISLVVVQ